MAASRNVARYATGWSFLVSGLVLSSWFVRLPALTRALELSSAEIGLASFTVAAGGVAAMQFAGKLTGRFGSGPVLRWATIGLPLLLIPPAVAGTFGALLLWLSVLGLGIGLLDVAMNAHGATVERVLDRSVMNSLHGAWSVGGIVGSGVAGAVAAVGLSMGGHFTAMAIVLCAISFVVTTRLLPATHDRSGSRSGSAERRSARWTAGWSGTAVRFGLLISCCLLAEGAVVNWGAVFMDQERGATPAVATLAYFAFSVMMAFGRLVGDRLTVRRGPVALIRAGSVIAATGLALGLLVPAVVPTVIAFGLCGAGMSVLVPTIFSAVGRESNRRDGSGAGVGASMARAATLGYGGVLGGPVLIGAAAQAVGLTLAMTIPVFLILLVGASGRRIGVGAGSGVRSGDSQKQPMACG